MACKKECFEAMVTTCSDIIIRAGFAPLYPLYYILTARNNNRVQRLATTNTDGELVIDQDNLPDGFLVVDGFVKIELRDGGNYLQAVLFQFDGEDYPCILAELVKTDIAESDTSERNVIQAITTATPADPGITFPVDADFRIDLRAGQDLEYVSLRNASSMNVTFGTTLGGTEILALTINSSLATVLMFHADTDISVYVGGILPGTTAKKKIS